MGRRDLLPQAQGQALPGSWSGTCRHTLPRDLYAAAYLANVVEDMCREAEGMAAAAGRPLECLWVFRAALEEMFRHTVPIRPGRSYPRSGISHGGKRRASCTHKRCY